MTFSNIRRIAMRKCTLILIVIALSAILMADARFGIGTNRPAFAPDLIKVKLTAAAESRSNLPLGLYAETAGFGINELDQLMRVNGGQKVIRAHRQVKDTAWAEKTGWDRWFLIKLDGRASVEQAIASFKANRYIETAIPEYYAYTTAVPNDTYYANNWGHNNTAQLPVYQSGGHTGPGVGTIGFDSDAQLAWDQSQGYGSASIVIAVIDTGVDTSHPDLRLVAGYDYGDNDSNPMDNSADPGHGTSCSGVAAGRANNALGVAGIAGGCSVMPLKVADSAGDMYFTAIENAITHAADNNADVISMSLGAEGGTAEGSSPTTDAALYYAYNAGVAIFAATANSNASTIAYPSNHTAVISVGASSPTGQRKSTTSSDGEYWWGSNYGTAVRDAKEAVDVMAPTILPATDLVGTIGYSTTDYYMWFNGTSCATPYAAGVAALVLSRDPSLTPAQLRTVLVNSATDMTLDGGAGWDRYTGYGLINANSALNLLNPTLPLCQVTSPVNGSIHDLGSIITVNATASDPDGTITSVAFYIDSVLKSTDTSSPYSWSWNTVGYSGGSHEIKAIATDNSSNTATSTISITLLAPPNEGFETGNFTLYPWTQSGTLPWVVQSADKYTGTYAAKSGAITHSQTSTMSVTLNINSSGNISFYQKVSSESGYDYLRFYIDDVQQGSWSGAGSWTAQSYAVNSGTRTFKWTYSKDSSVSSGTDCAYVDHIIFPPHTVPSVYNPPQNLAATAGNGVVHLTWQAPVSGSPTGYKVFRNSVYLTTATGLSYDDNAVVNGTTYSYYLTAVYSGGESDPTSTVQATPISYISVNIGSGTSATPTNQPCPINLGRQSLHGQSVYTKDELNAGGIYGPVKITHMGFYIVSQPSLTLPNFIVRMKHTTASNVSSWQTSAGMVTVFSTTSYIPAPGGYDMLTLATPFTWNGTDNIVIDTAFSLVSSASNTGTIRYSSVTNGYRYVRNNTADQTTVFTGGSVSVYRPNVRLTFQFEPQIAVTPSSLSYGVLNVGASSVQQFTIQNTGNATLTGNISTPEGYTVAASAKGTRNTLGFTVPAQSSQTFDLTFAPSQGIAYNGNLTITSNDTANPTLYISLSGSGNNPPTIVLPDEFHFDMNGSLVVDFDPYVNDADGNPITLTVGGNTNIVANIDGLNVTFTATTDWIGSENLTFIVDDGNAINFDTVAVTVDATDIFFRGKAFLQGPYVSGGSMNHALTSVLPLVSPYDANHSVAALPDVSPRYIVDWVYVQLRATSTGANEQAQSAFLLSDGSIAGLNGNTTLAFDYTGQTNYFLLVQHRNHLGIMSAVSQTFSLVPVSAPLIDLSAVDSVWGGNSTGVKLVEPGVLAMYSGDADHDGSVSPSDLNLYWRVQTGLSGYRNADFNLDNIVAPTDLNLCWRLNTGLQSQIPAGAKGSDSGLSRPFDTRQ